MPSVSLVYLLSLKMFNLFTKIIYFITIHLSQVFCKIKSQNEMSVPITKKDFLKDLKDFKNLKRKRKKEIFDLAWQAKNFEIELYWKRAGYFWAFQALVLAGLIAIVASKYLIEKNLFLHYTVCLGLITSLGWYLTNKGSKVWQRHWECLVDVLEDY